MTVDRKRLMIAKYSYTLTHTYALTADSIMCVYLAEKWICNAN